MSVITLLLLFGSTTCWAINPIFESVEPQLFDSEVPNKYKLPTNVEPINYKIELETYFDVPKDALKFTFHGKSAISLKVKKSTKSIRFHAKNLTILYDNVTLEQFRDNQITRIELDKYEEDKPECDTNFVTLTFKKELEVSNESTRYILNILYNGKLNDELRGFYRSSYRDGSNNTRWLATTHFEPVSARRAFPCWDEPKMKATFDITIKHSSNYHALSNMEKKSENTDEANITTTIFSKTPKMSTYLVAFLVSDYWNVTNKDGKFNVWTRPQMIGSASYALEMGHAIMTELEKFTGIKYKNHEMTKMDQVTIPDFAPGAMENWGLVMYREPALLYTENVTTTLIKQSIVSVIAHELSHQWFGNLVSPKLWTYIWLNEGFATFFQYYIAEKVMENEGESWRLMEQFVIKNLQASAFVTDAGPKAHPMNQDASTPAEIQSLFNDITYKKAASVIRMMQHFLTENVFKSGLKAYLTQKRFDSANSNDLITAIASLKAFKEPFDIIMNNWVNETGYPIVTLTTDQDSNYILTQEQFYLVKPERASKTNWWIPINYVTNKQPEINSTKPFFWLRPKEIKKLENLKQVKWIIINNNQTGYYRVNYNEEIWNHLATHLNSDKYNDINPISRSQLIDDALNIARAGKLSYKSALKMTTYLSKEIDYIPWYAAIRAFDHLDCVLQKTKEHKILHKYVAQKLKALVKAVKLTNKPRNDTHVEKLARVLALTTACKYGHKECNIFAKQEFNKWLNNLDYQLLPDLKSGILCAGLRHADEATWNKTLDRYINGKDESEKPIILSGFGCIASESIVEKFLALTLDKKPVVDIFSAMNSVHAGNAASFDILVRFIHQNIDYIQAADKKSTWLTAYLNKLSDKVASFEQYGKLALLVNWHKLQSDGKFEGMTRAMYNLQWFQSHADDVVAWLKENYKEDKHGNSANSITLPSLLVIISVFFVQLY